MINEILFVLLLFKQLLQHEPSLYRQRNAVGNFSAYSHPRGAVSVLREESTKFVTIDKLILRRKRVLFGSAYARRGLNCLW